MNGDRRLTVRTGEAWVPLGYRPLSPFVGGLLRLHLFRRAFRALMGPQIYLPTDDLARHVLVVGLTGAYKTTAVTFPVLLEAARHGVSVVALDLTYVTQYATLRTRPFAHTSHRPPKG